MEKHDSRDFPHLSGDLFWKADTQMHFKLYRESDFILILSNQYKLVEYLYSKHNTKGDTQEIRESALRKA